MGVLRQIEYQLLRFFGGMNKDSEYPDIKQGDTLEVLNARTITTQGSTTGSLEVMQGNKFVFDLGSVVQQNKKYVCTFYTDVVTIYPFVIRDQNQNDLTPELFFDNTSYIGNPTGFISYIVSTINSNLSGQTAIITSSIVSSIHGYVFIELTTVLGINYFIDTSISEVLQEAIDLSMIGAKEQIGNVDLLGDLFILSTPVKKDREGLAITSVTNTSPMLITTSAPHGLLTGENVLIKNVLGATNANGFWIIQLFSPTQFYLIGSLGGIYTGGGAVVTTPNGYGEIGVAQKDTNDNWTYIKLVSTREFNFRTTHQAEVKAESDGLRKSIYWTNNDDYYRVAYYYGDYVTNGFLSQVNNKAIYTYEAIGDETRLFLGTPSPKLTVTQNNGGSKKCGNYRYSVRFIVEGNIGTEWSFLTNPINVFLGAGETDLNAQFITGGLVTDVSTKANSILVENIPIGLFNYVELAAIQYVGNAPVGAIVKRQRISQTISSAVIIDSGATADEIELDLTTLNQIFYAITKGQNLTLLDNRLIPSNFSVQEDLNLSEWAHQIQYTVKRKEIETIGFASDLTAGSNLKLGENLVPENTVEFTGYMINETIRTGIQLKHKNGGWMSPYHIADITIDTSGIGGQRLGGLPDNSLTNTTISGETVSYSFYVEFTNLDLNYILPDGLRLYEHLDMSGEPNIRFVRAEIVKEVLATGMLVMGDTSPPTEPTVNFIDITTFAGSTTYGYFYSPDVYFNKAYPSSGVLKFLDNPNITSQWIDPSGTDPSILTEYDGYYAGSSFVDVAIDSISVVNIPAGSFQLERKDLVLIQSNTALTPPLANGAIDYGFYYVQIFRAIANKYGDIANTKYITTGNAYASEGVTTSSTFDMFGGDTFTQKTYKILTQKIIPISLLPLIEEGIGYGFGFYSQNRTNAQMQLKSDDTDTLNITLPGTYGSNSDDSLRKWIKPMEMNPGTNEQERINHNLNVNNYNLSYNIQNLIQFYIGFDPLLPQISYYPTRTAWSEEKTINGVSDAYRIILPLNFRDAAPSLGEISHQDTANGQLLTWQWRNFIREYFNSVGQLTSADNSQILIGDGSVMTRIGDDLTLYGTRNKWGIVKGLSPGGKDTFYWINEENKKLIRFGLDGTVVLSDIKGMQSFFANNLQYTLDHKTPIANYGICGVWNNRFAESIITVRAINPYATLSVVGQTVVSGTLKYGAVKFFDGTPIVYVAKSNFIISDSNNVNSPDNDVYWEKLNSRDSRGYNLYTIVINEYTNKISNFCTFKPKSYLKYMDGFLSPHPTSSNRICEHDKDEHMEWYSEEVTGIGSIYYTTLSNQIMGVGTDFVSEFPVVEATVYYLLIGTEEYEIDVVNSATSLTLKENVVITGGATLSYRRVNSEDGYAEIVVNEQPDVVKGYRAIRTNSKNVLDRTEFVTATTKSSLIESDYQSIEGIFQAAIKFDETITAENPTGSNELDTSRIFGKWMKVKLYFKKRNYNKLFDIIIKFTPKSRLR